MTCGPTVPPDAHWPSPTTWARSMLPIRTTIALPSLCRSRNKSHALRSSCGSRPVSSGTPHAQTTRWKSAAFPATCDAIHRQHQSVHASSWAEVDQRVRNRPPARASCQKVPELPSQCLPHTCRAELAGQSSRDLRIAFPGGTKCRGRSPAPPGRAGSIHPAQAP